MEVQLGSLQILRVHKGDVKGVNPQWNKDLMFVVAEPFEELLVILVKDRVGNKVLQLTGLIARCVLWLPSFPTARKSVEKHSCADVGCVLPVDRRKSWGRSSYLCHLRSFTGGSTAVPFPRRKCSRVDVQGPVPVLRVLVWRL